MVHRTLSQQDHLHSHEESHMKVHIYRTTNSNRIIILGRNTWKNKYVLVKYVLQVNNYFIEKLVGLPPQLILLAVCSRKPGHDNMSEQCNHICQYSKYEHMQFNSGMGTQTQTDSAYTFFPLNPSTFRVVPSNLASHAHVIPLLFWIMQLALQD